MAKDVNARVSPPDTGWGLFKKKPKEMSPEDWDDFIDTVQDRLRKINPKIDTFLNSKLNSLIEDCRLSIVNGNHAMTTLRFKRHKDPKDDQNNRRIDRLGKVIALLDITKNSLDSLSSSIIDKQENLTDFKVVAVPTILNQLSNIISSNGDNKQFSNVLASFSNIKVTP